MDWDDPDGGDSEISHYRIMFKAGFWGEEKQLKIVNNPSFVDYGLEPGKTYYYKIIPVNRIGEATSSEEFKAETQPV